MALRKFTPDPDLFDPEDPEGWYGTWEHDDGSQLYGQGTEDMGRPLLDQEDSRLAENDAAPQDDAAGKADARRYAEDLGITDPIVDDDTEQADVATPPIAGMGAKPAAPAAAPVNPAAPNPAAPPADDGSSWDDKVPPQVSNALRQQAVAAGLNPDALAGVIQHESGWNPAAVNAKTNAHAGLIQFSKDGWGAVAAAAGHPDVTWDQMRQMSAEEQIPFVVAYYKGKGLKEDSTPADYAMRTFMPAYAGESDDFALGEKGSNEMRGDVRSGKVYEQNEQLDLNRDGKITKGEVGEAYTGRKGAPGGATSPRMGGAPSPLAGVPSSLGGVPLAAAEVQGVPLTPEQIDQRQKDVGQRYAVQAAAQQQGLAQRIQGRQEVMDAWNAEATRQQTDAAAQQQVQERARLEAEQKIQAEVSAPIQKVDAGRLIKNMSVGAKVMGGIAIVMSELGRGAMALAGVDGGQNLALNIIMKRIDDDIGEQKENIANEAQAKNNRVAFWTKKLGSAEQGVSAARAEAHQAAGMMLQAKAMASDIADVRAQGTELAATLFGQAQQEIQNITDREQQRLTVRYAVPPPPKGAKEKTLADSIESAKKARQELELAGHSPEETKQLLAANGIPYIAGDTVDQNKHKTDQAREDANEANKLSEPQAKAEAAHQSVTDFATKAGLVRDPKTGKWTVGEGAVPPGFLESINPFSDNAIQTALEAAVEGYGRQQSGGVIGDNERESFYSQLGRDTGNRRQLAAKLNAAELNIEAKRKQDIAAIRNGTTNTPPGGWK